MIRLSVAQARALICNALTGAGTAKRNVGYLTEAMLDTELSGLEGHGFYWLQYYCAHVKSGKVDGKARPSVSMRTPVSIVVDTKRGFAHPAIEAGFKKLVPAAKRYGIAAMAVQRSYSGATLGYHTGVLAKQGLLCFGFTNAMPALAPVGGKKAVIGTNPMSFAVPGAKGKIAFLIDQSSSVVPWTKVKRAAELKQKIPLGWALDKNGKATEDPAKGLLGSMMPAGGYKGFGQGLIVEVMCAALANSLRGPEMGSFVDDDGKSIGCGQFFIAIDPKFFGKVQFDKQVKALIKSIETQGGRMPNAKREATQKRLKKSGLTLDKKIYETLLSYCK